MKSIKFSEVVNIIKSQYVFLKLKPNNSIRNNGTHKLARTISSLYKSVWENVKKEEGELVRVLGKEFLFGTKFSYQVPSKVSYYIYIEKKMVNFYFIVPSNHLSIVKEKINDVWSGVTMEEVKELPSFSNSCTKYELVFEKEDGLSLNVDRRSNDLLHSNLNIVEVLEDGDKVGIFYNFIPVSPVSWKHQYRHTIEKFKKGIPVDRKKVGLGYALKLTISMVDGLVNNISETIAGKRPMEEENVLVKLLDKLNGGRKVSEATAGKANTPILGTQMVVLSESTDKLRERNNGRSLAQSFDTISEDNRLTFSPFKKSFRFTDYNIKSQMNKVSDLETQNFISLAGREVLERYNFIEKVNTQETQIPEDLQEGVMWIGNNTYRGMVQQTYLSNDEQFRNLLLLLIGPTRAGKSNLISNISYDAIKNDECVIIFDFIENCELSEEVASHFPKDKVLNIDCGDFRRLQGLGYNEVGTSIDVFERYENAKRQTANMLTLINSINQNSLPLSPKMERYLESASLVVFINNGSIKNVFGVLLNHKTRHDFIDRVPKSQLEFLQDYIDSLRELDELDKAGNVVGTDIQAGIIDRLNTLKRNTYMELMLKKDTKGNVNLVEEMQKNQLICIKMPQSMFTTDGEKDICTTYWITKIWLALQVRADKIRDKSKRKKVNLIIDEIYQVPNTEKFLTSKLSQMAKFILKPIVSCHYINQLKHMREELRSANTSYMLIAGCDKKNFDELKHELYPFTDEDLKNLKRYHAMNYVKCKEGYARFITELPPKFDDRIRNETKNKNTPQSQDRGDFLIG